METALFWIFATAAIGSGAGVVLSIRNTVAAALWLVASMLSLAVLFVLLHAEFIGLIQVMIYAGAIVVLFLFVIMLLNLKSDGMGAENQLLVKLVGAGIAAIVAVKLAAIVAAVRTDWSAVPREFGTVREVGRALYTDFLLPFEIAGVLLLAAIVGAVVLAKREIE